MELSQAERVRMVVRWLAEQRGVNQRDIGALVGYNNPSALSHVLNAKKTVPDTLPPKIAALDPRINIHFMDCTSDDMLVPGNEQPSVSQPSEPPRSVGIFIPQELAQMVTDLTSTIREQQGMIRTLIDRWAKEEKQ